MSCFEVILCGRDFTLLVSLNRRSSQIRLSRRHTGAWDRITRGLWRLPGQKIIMREEPLLERGADRLLQV